MAGGGGGQEQSGRHRRDLVTGCNGTFTDALKLPPVCFLGVVCLKRPFNPTTNTQKSACCVSQQVVLYCRCIF